MLAVCYNNIAVEHLAMRKYEDACVASQNARRLARLSLSYSNRYLRHFETTHNVALRRFTTPRRSTEVCIPEVGA